ncbi:MAG TPA: hypothetical protein DEB24_08205 [Coriobacteriia bacterium]|nr:hypothetical protein [Coriobacteriia bacterium]
MNEKAAIKKALQRKRFLYLGLGMLALLFLGLVYAWSIFATPLNKEFGWGSSALSITFSISIVMFVVSGFVSSLVMKKTSPKVTLTISAVCMGAGFVMTGLFAHQGIWVVYVFYGLFIGSGCGFGYNTLLSTVNAWFPDRVGFSSGALLLGYGLGALILGSVADILMTNLGISSAFYILGIFGVVFLIIIGLSLRLPNAGLEEYFPRKSADAKDGGKVSYSFKPIDLARSPLFWVFIFWVVTIATVCLTLIGTSKQGALTLEIDAGFATLLVGLISTVNGCARMFWGVFYDRFGLIKAMILMSCVAFAATILLVLSFANLIGGIYIAGALLIGLCFGGCPVLVSSFTMTRFGPDNYPQNLGVATVNLIPASFLNSLISTPLREIGGDLLVYSAMSGLVVIGAIVLIFFAKRYRYHMDHLAELHEKSLTRAESTEVAAAASAK